MKAIGSTMRGIYLLIKPANVAAQKQRLVLKSAQHSTVEPQPDRLRRHHFDLVAR
jgi:hypothetical protein